MTRGIVILSVLIGIGLQGAEPVVVGAGMQGYVIRDGRVHAEDVAVPYTGEVRVPRSEGHTEVRLYHEGWRQGVWKIVTAQGVVVRETVYHANNADHAATGNRLEKLFAQNVEGYASQPKIIAETAYRAGQFWYHRQRYQIALKYFGHALEILKPEDSRYTDVLVNVARANYHLGIFQRSEQQLVEVVGLIEKQKGKESLSLIYPLRKLANLYRHTQDHQSVIDPLVRARKIFTKAGVPNSWSALQNRLELSVAWKVTGNRQAGLEMALKVYQEIDRRPGLSGKPHAEACRHLAMHLRGMQRYEEALNYCREELGIRKQLPPDRYYGVHAVHREMGELHQALHDQKEAVEQYQAGLVYFQKHFGLRVSWAVSSIALLAETHMNLGQLGEAEAALALLDSEWDTLEGNFEYRMRICQAQWRLARQQGKPDAAGPWAAQIKALHESRVQEIIQYGSERQRWVSRAMKPVYEYLADGGNSEMLAEHLLRTRGWVVASAKMDLRIAEQLDDPAVQGLLAERRQVVAALETHARQMQLNKRRKQLKLETSPVPSRRPLVVQLDQINKQLHAAARQSDKWMNPLEATVPQLKQALPAKGVLLEYLRYPRFTNEAEWVSAYGCLVLTRDQPAQWVPLGWASEIDSLLKAADMDRPRPDHIFERQMQALHDQLLAPTRKHWPANTETLLVCADHELGLQSLAVWMDSDKQFLGETHAIAYLHTASDLLVPDSAAHNNQVMVFADPTFESSQGGAEFRVAASMREDEAGRFHSLPKSRSEAEAIRALVQSNGRQAGLYLGEAANEAQLRTVNSPAVLHLATHGMGGQQRSSASMRSVTTQLLGSRYSMGLALAGAQHSVNQWRQGNTVAAEQDGLLTSAELGILRLGSTQLVVLSACSSGTGRTTRGQGVLGMRRGLALAGARNVLMTQWPVSDHWTSLFMKDFYQAYLKGVDPVEALGIVQARWLKQLREEEGAKVAAQIAGPFFITTQGAQ